MDDRLAFVRVGVFVFHLIDGMLREDQLSTVACRIQTPAYTVTAPRGQASYSLSTSTPAGPVCETLCGAHGDLQACGRRNIL